MRYFAHHTFLHSLLTRQAMLISGILVVLTVVTLWISDRNDHES